MKKNIVSILAYALLGLSTLMVSCGGDSQSGDQNNVTNVASEMASLKADISGMTCEVGCAKTIEKMLSETEGVVSAKVDFEKKAAFVDYDKAKVSEADLLAAINKFKDGSYSAKKAEDKVKETAKSVTKKVEKEVKKVETNIKASTTTTVKKLNEEAAKTVNKGKTTLKNAEDKATKELEEARKEVNKNIDAIKKSATDINANASKKAKTLKDASKIGK